jgi:stage II sporulation protein D
VPLQLGAPERGSDGLVDLGPQLKDAGRLRWAALLALSAGCARIEVGALPAAETVEPTVRVGLILGAPRLAVGGGSALVVSEPDGGGLSLVPEGSTATLLGGSSGLRARLGSITTAAAATLQVRPRDAGGTVRLEGRDYRGEVAVTAAGSGGGLLAVNLVSLEEYVAGVVNAEMGRRPAGDREAVYAQAVVSRTVALRALGRYRVRGYDLTGTVADQAYGGVAAETELGWEAVRATRGEVLSYGGALIEAFFHSTCGGRTAAVEEAFSGAPQPYLRSVVDRGPNGEAYCALSPRFRWREEWTAQALAGALLAARGTNGWDAAASAPSDLQISARTPSGRVGELLLVAGAAVHPIAGQAAIRQALRPADGGLLRSTLFTLQVSRTGGRIVRLVASGAGNGHGVGLCQWGAVGRARAGFSYREILSAYFPGTEVRRFY